MCFQSSSVLGVTVWKLHSSCADGLPWARSSILWGHHLLSWLMPVDSGSPGRRWRHELVPQPLSWLPSAPSPLSSQCLCHASLDIFPQNLSCGSSSDKRPILQTRCPWVSGAIGTKCPDVGWSQWSFIFPLISQLWEGSDHLTSSGAEVNPGRAAAVCSASWWRAALQPVNGSCPTCARLGWAWPPQCPQQGAEAGPGPGSPDCHHDVSGSQGCHHVPQLRSCSLLGCPRDGPLASTPQCLPLVVSWSRKRSLGETRAGGHSWAKPWLPWACTQLSPSRHASASAGWRKKIFGKRTGFQR